MSNVAVIQPTSEAEQPYLGPARVREVQPHQVLVQRPGEECAWARLALAFCYELQIDDELLVIGNDQGTFVIGVLQGSGTARLTFPGDVELRSTTGRVRVAAATGVELDAPEVNLQAKRIRMLAGKLTERLGTLYQTVTETLNLRAGATHTMVAGTAYTQAKRSTLLTRDEVTINGKSINLG
ncbi:MAG: hypothetical protein DRI90_13560 [Deltaproteobacteria bacterium]|nr:MAG: hypothetical protein DRI90_13560 [Deltaproteobacteria bacterium]